MNELKRSIECGQAIELIIEAINSGGNPFRMITKAIEAVHRGNLTESFVSNVSSEVLPEEASLLELGLDGFITPKLKKGRKKSRYETINSELVKLVDELVPNGTTRGMKLTIEEVTKAANNAGHRNQTGGKLTERVISNIIHRQKG